MDKIKVEEYVRTDNGRIGQVFDITERGRGVRYAGEFITDTIISISTDKVGEIRLKEKDIVYHSFNIKKLLKKGDIVNGFTVEEFDDEEGNDYLGIPIYDDAELNCIEEVRPIDTIQIKTILTKEQYERNCYVVKEE